MNSPIFSRLAQPRKSTIYLAASRLMEGCWRWVTVITKVRSSIAVRSCQQTFLARKLHALRAPVSPPLLRMTETLLLVRSLLLLTRQAVTSFCYTILLLRSNVALRHEPGSPSPLPELHSSALH